MMTLRRVLLLAIAAMPVLAQAQPAPSPMAPAGAIDSCQPQPECRLRFLRSREPGTLPLGIELKGRTVTPDVRGQQGSGTPPAGQAPSR